MRERDSETQTGRVGGVCQKWRNRKVTKSFQVFLFCCLGEGQICEGDVKVADLQVVSICDWACRFLTLGSDWGQVKVI